MTINFDEFFEYLEDSTRLTTGRMASYIVHFKPERYDENQNLLLSSNPEVCNDVFSVYTAFLRHDNFKVIYPYQGTEPIKTNLQELKAMFEDKGWKNFTPYKPETELKYGFGT